MGSLLTKLEGQVYPSPVAPHGRPGLTSCKQSAQALIMKRLFCVCRSMADASGALRSAAPLCGKVNPVALRRPLAIDLVGGGSLRTDDLRHV